MERGGMLDVGMNVEQLAHLQHDFEIEVIEKFVVVLEEGVQVVSIILEERALIVGRLQGVPMYAAPGAVVADADVADEPAATVLDGHGERLGTVGRSNDTAVAVGLLDERLAGLHRDTVGTVQLTVPVDGTEISGGEEDCHGCTKNRSVRQPSHKDLPGS